MKMTVQELIADSHQISLSKGWWENKERNVGELLALIHSEISEALEVYRDHGVKGLSKTWLGENDKPEGFTVELADAVIRIMDLCAGFDLDLEEALRTKMNFNRSRPHRHGGKIA